MPTDLTPYIWAALYLGSLREDHPQAADHTFVEVVDWQHTITDWRTRNHLARIFRWSHRMQRDPIRRAMFRTLFHTIPKDPPT